MTLYTALESENNSLIEYISYTLILTLMDVNAFSVKNWVYNISFDLT